MRRLLISAGLVSVLAAPGLLVPAAAAEVDSESWPSEESVVMDPVAVPVVDPLPSPDGEALLCDDDKLKETLEKIALIKNVGLPSLRKQLADKEKEITRLQEEGLRNLVIKNARKEALEAWDAQLITYNKRPAGSSIQHPEKLYGPRANLEAALAEAEKAVTATKAAFDTAKQERADLEAKILLLQAILKALEESLPATACVDPPSTPVTVIG